MAGDLIPPPSPAGRPDPDAMAGVRATPQIEPPPEEPAPPTPSGPPPYRSRFGFVWGALAGVAVCAGVLAVLLATAPRDAGPPLAANWSEWKPSTSRMLDGAVDIAAHVAAEYKLDSGQQLTAVRVSEMELAGRPLGVAVRPKGGNLEVLEGDGLLYLLSAVTPGTEKSAARERLLRREALELALFSFRYLEDVTMVAIVLPPGEGEAEQSRALFYRPGDLLEQLQMPLTRTLSADTPRPKTMTKAEAARVDSLALRNFFHFSIQPLDNDRDYLVLAEPEVVS